MLRRLAAEFVRWLVEKWASGQIDEARRKEEWEDQREDFKDASERWDEARRKREGDKK